MVITSASPSPRPAPAETPIGPTSPTSVTGGTPPELLPPSVPHFGLWHAHPTLTRLFVANATLMLPPGRVTCQEVGENVKPEHDFSFSCGEFKEARLSAVNRAEKKTIEHLSIRDPAKLSLRAARSCGQMFEERDKVAALVRALHAHCGKR